MTSLLLVLLVCQERPKLVEYTDEGVARTPAGEGLLDRLDAKTIALTLDAASPARAFAALAEASGTAIEPDAAVLEAKAEPLTLRLREVRASTALYFLCDLYGVTPAFGEAAVAVTLPAREGEGDLPARYYDVADLTFSPRDFPSGWDGGELSVETIVDLIQYSVDPAGWDADGHSIQSRQSMLIVRTTPEAHREIEGFLSQMRSVRDARVRTEVRIVAMDESLLRTLRRDGAEIGGKALEALHDALDRGKAELLGAVEVVCFNAQRVAPTTEGLRVELRPVCNHDLTMVTTEVRLTTEEAALRTTVAAPSGALTIAGSFKAEDSKRAVVLMQSTTERTAGESVAVRSPATMERVVETRGRIRAATLTAEARETTVTRALRQIAAAAGCDVILDPRLSEFDEARVEMPEGERPATELLDAVAGAYGLAWQVLDGFVLVTAADRPVEQTGMPVVVYPVADLQQSILSFPGPILEPLRTDDPFSDAVIDFEEGEVFCGVDALTDLVMQSTGGASWDESDYAAITLVNNMLIVKQFPEVHVEIAKLLQGLRARDRSRQVRTEARVVALDEKLLRSLREAEDLEAMLAEAIEGERATLLAAGELVTHDTQRAHVLLVDSERHVVAYDEEGRPIEASVDAGWVLDATPVTVEDGGSLKLELRYARLGRATIETVETAHGPVARPKQALDRIETSLSLPSGRTVIAGSLGATGSRRSVLLLRSTVIGVE